MIINIFSVNQVHTLVKKLRIAFPDKKNKTKIDKKKLKENENLKKNYKVNENGENSVEAKESNDCVVISDNENSSSNECNEDEIDMLYSLKKVKKAIKEKKKQEPVALPHFDLDDFDLPDDEAQDDILENDMDNLDDDDDEGI